MQQKNKTKLSKIVSFSLLASALFVTSCKTEFNDYRNSSSSSETVDSSTSYTKLLRPASLVFNETSLSFSWAQVTGATSYTINVNGNIINNNVQTTNFSFRESHFNNGNTFLISVKANGNNETSHDSSYSTILYEKLGTVVLTNYQYSLNDDNKTISITGLQSGVSLTTIDIDSEIGGMEVTKIAATAFRNNRTVTSVILPTTIVEIEDNAFYGCQNLASLTLNEGLEHIGTAAFRNTRIATLNIPSTLLEIGAEAFYACRNLVNVNFPENANLSTIGESAFYNCGAIVELNFPRSLTLIGESAFRNNEKLERLNFHSNGLLEELGAQAFRGCDSLTEITLPSSLKVIGEDCFYSLPNLAAIMYEENSNLEIIGEGAFEQAGRTLIPMGASYFGPVSTLTDKPKTAIFPASVKQIGNSAFNRHQYESISFESGSQLELIDESAFTTIVALKRVDLPQSIKEVRASAFYNCSSLDTITTPADCQLNYFDRQAIAGTLIANEDRIIINNILIKDTLNSSTTNITIPEGITYLGPNLYATTFDSNVTVSLPSSLIGIHEYAFNGLNLTSITFNQNLMFIGDYAFYRCTQLKSITFPSNSKLESIGNYAFAQLDTTIATENTFNSLVLPNSLKTIGDNAFYENVNLASITFGADSQLEVIGAAAFSRNDALTSIIIPSSVIEIKDEAFLPNCSTASTSSDTLRATSSSLTSVSFSGGSRLESIGSRAFMANLITTLNLPDNLKTIGAEAFEHNLNLSSVSVSPSSQLEIIGDSAFRNCALVSFYIPNTILSIGTAAFRYNKALERVTFGPDAFKSLENPEDGILANETFAECSLLETINLPSGIYEIQNQAFSNCTALLTINTEAEIISRNAFTNTAWMNSFSSGLAVLNNIVISYSGSDVNVVIPEGITRINGEVFRYNEIETLSLPASIEYLGAGAFDSCIDLRSITIPANNNLEYIGDNAFRNCYLLTTFTFSSSLSYLGSGAFDNCNLLSSANLSMATNLENIGNNAFRNCYALETILLPNNLISIGEYAFNRTKLTEVSLPSSLISIGAYAFSDIGYYGVLDDGTVAEELTYTLAKLEMNEDSLLASIGIYAFANNAIESLDFPKKSPLSIENYAFTNSLALKEVYFHENVTLGVNVLMGSDSVEVIKHSGNYSTSNIFGGTASDLPNVLTKIIIGEGVLAIADNAFNGYSKVEEFIIPSSITSIGKQAFYGCTSLTTINLENVVSIDDEAFFGCNKLETISFGSDLAYIGSKVFEATKWLRDQTEDFIIINDILVSYRGDETSVIIPENVKEIAGGAFSGNNYITSIVVNGNLEAIQAGALDSCISLEEIQFNGDVVVQIDIYLFETTNKNLKITVSDKEKYLENIYWKLYSDYLA